ncbi:MAG: PspC domain-containing protein [Lactobacillales bacterium]|jgi:phage shock protein C|nr:PspC domain-containing protein [Lactobacillales bacterium]
MSKKLYRSSTDSVFTGVAGGLGQYFGIDPTWVRIAWVIFFLISCGTAALLYLVCYLLIPSDYGQDQNGY